ncbi:MAG: ATP synthase F0 subunit B [Chloroflexi bacterium RBG_16_52_11]|nr:MAG: ATP synthase F0 subunit B [Chloroflexi bacterium RBG_16_52_11]
MEALGLNLGYLLVQIFNFAIVFVVLRAWIVKPIIALLEKRRAAIAQGLEDARIAAEARANAEKEAREIIARAQAEAQQKVREAADRAEQAAREVQARADAEAAKIREDARLELAQERDRTLTDVRGQIAALSMAATQRLIGEALDEKRQHVLIEEFFSGVKSGKVVVLEGASIRGASAEITSALPLTPAEAETVKRDLLAKIGSQATVTFRVDPNILGGLVVRVGDKVLDGSVSGQLETLRQSLR